MELRKIQPDIPIILCTGYSSKINKEGAKNFGINALAKKTNYYQWLTSGKVFKVLIVTDRLKKGNVSP